MNLSSEDVSAQFSQRESGPSRVAAAGMADTTRARARKEFVSRARAMDKAIASRGRLFMISYLMSANALLNPSKNIRMIVCCVRALPHRRSVWLYGRRQTAPQLSPIGGMQSLRPSRGRAASMRPIDSRPVNHSANWPARHFQLGRTASLVTTNPGASAKPRWCCVHRYGSVGR